MPSYLHRATKQILNSVASADLPESLANYIEYPDLTAVVGQPSKYWIITADVISLMDQAAMDAVDAAELESNNDSLATNLDRVVMALVLVLNDGSLIPGSNYTNLQIKNIIKAKL